MNLNMYFFYTKMFAQNCLESFTESCSREIIDKSFMNWSDLERCVEGTFTGNENVLYQNENSLLAASKIRAELLKVDTVPNLYFNDVQYKASYAFSDLSMAVCELLNKEVEECHEIPLLEVDDLNVAGLVILMVSVFLVGLLIMGLICKKIAKRNYLR